MCVCVRVCVCVCVCVCVWSLSSRMYVLHVAPSLPSALPPPHTHTPHPPSTHTHTHQCLTSDISGSQDGHAERTSQSVAVPQQQALSAANRFEHVQHEPTSFRQHLHVLLVPVARGLQRHHPPPSLCPRELQLGLVVAGEDGVVVVLVWHQASVAPSDLSARQKGTLSGQNVAGYKYYVLLFLYSALHQAHEKRRRRSSGRLIQSVSEATVAAKVNCPVLYTGVCDVLEDKSKDWGWFLTLFPLKLAENTCCDAMGEI